MQLTKMHITKMHNVSNYKGTHCYNIANYTDAHHLADFFILTNCSTRTLSPELTRTTRGRHRQHQDLLTTAMTAVGAISCYVT